MIDLTLSVEEVNVIMGCLGRLPYDQVDGLINKIRAQALPQLPEKMKVE